MATAFTNAPGQVQATAVIANLKTSPTHFTQLYNYLFKIGTFVCDANGRRLQGKCGRF